MESGGAEKTLTQVLSELLESSKTYTNTSLENYLPLEGGNLSG
jgi:hypothetical protein